MAAILAAGLSVVFAALIALAGSFSGWVLAGAVGLSVFALALGWAHLLELPQVRGTALVVAGTGVVALLVAVQVQGESRPLAAFAGVLGAGVLAAFGHELLRRDGRADLIESITGTLSGQVLAVLAAGWLLLPDTRAGPYSILVVAAAVAAVRAATALPYPARVTAWLGFALGVVGALATSLLLPGFDSGTAAIIGVAVAGAVVALDRLLSGEATRRDGGERTAALLATATAPVAVAGTVAYAALRLVVI